MTTTLVQYETDLWVKQPAVAALFAYLNEHGYQLEYIISGHYRYPYAAIVRKFPFPMIYFITDHTYTVDWRLSATTIELEFVAADDTQVSTHIDLAEPDSFERVLGWLQQVQRDSQ